MQFALFCFDILSASVHVDALCDCIQCFIRILQMVRLWEHFFEISFAHVHHTATRKTDFAFSKKSSRLETDMRPQSVYKVDVLSHASLKIWTAEFLQGRKPTIPGRGSWSANWPHKANLQHLGGWCARTEEPWTKELWQDMSFLATLSKGSCIFIRACARSLHLSPQNHFAVWEETSCGTLQENSTVLPETWGGFLRRVVTGDEIWLCYYDPESQQQSA